MKTTCSAWLIVLLAVSAGAGLSAAQSEDPAAAPAVKAGATRPAYVLGPDDEITIHALEAEEISDKPMRIGTDGAIDLPLAGRVHAAGLTVEQFEAELSNRLKVYVKEPQVSVNVVEMRSQPVSVIGSVTTPGVHQLQGHKTLVEILSLAGGLRQDAGYSAKITRMLEWGSIPLPNAHNDETNKFSIAEVNLKDITDAKNPGENIQIMPNDVISVPRAEMVYVIGDVTKSGGIVLGDQQTVTVLQALSMASGLTKTAKSTGAKIMRQATPGATARVEIPVNLKALLAGKINDIPMQAEDILFVPNSSRREFTTNTLQAVIGSGLTAVIYRVP